MTQSARIVGISLLKNEEYFAYWSISNIVEFCDELIVVDNLSTDRTPEKLERLASRHPRITIHRVTDPNSSHQFIEPYAGRNVWVFGVDGDEVYDPAGLARLRPRILAGEFDRYWRIDGYMLHPIRMNPATGRAHGYVTPHTPPGNKLYNFGALESWIEPNRERLHGHNMKFRDGYSGGELCSLYRQGCWDDADLRCLHLCFFPRTSAEVEAPLPSTRRNPSELRARGTRRVLNWLRNFLANPFSRDAGYKTRRYRRGPLVHHEVAAFGRPMLWIDDDTQAREAEDVLAGRP